MFHFPASPPAPYELQTRVTPHNGRRVPPFGNPRITARKPAPRGISQATTSFIGPQCQGIHRTLITTNTHKQLNKHNHDTCGTRRPATTRPPPPNQERRKQERRREDGTTGGGPRTTKHQHRNPSNPTTRARRSFTYYRCSRPLCSSQPTRPHPLTQFLEEGVFGPGRTAPEPDSVPRPAPTETQSKETP